MLNEDGVATITAEELSATADELKHEGVDAKRGVDAGFVERRAVETIARAVMGEASLAELIASQIRVAVMVGVRIGRKQALEEVNARGTLQTP